MYPRFMTKDQKYVGPSDSSHLQKKLPPQWCRSDSSPSPTQTIPPSINNIPLQYGYYKNLNHNDL